MEYPTSHLYFLAGYTHEPLNEKVLFNYFIPCHRKYSAQHNQCDIGVDFILNDFELAS